MGGMASPRQGSISDGQFESWVRDHQMSMRRLATCMANARGADKIVENAQARAWTRCDAFDAQHGSPRVWLLAAVAEQVRGRLRLGVPNVRLGPRGGTRAAVDRLPRRQRFTVVLHHYVGLPVAEVAEFVRWAPGSVKSTLHDARSRLARTLGEQEVDELLHEDAARWREQVDGAGADRIRLPVGRRRYPYRLRRWLLELAAAVVLVIASIVLIVHSDRDSSNPRGGPGPDIPVRVTASVDGRAVTSATNLPVRAGSRVTFSAHVDAPADATIENGYLFLAVAPYGNGPDGPSGNVRVLVHRSGVLADRALTASWTAAPAFGRTTLTVAIEFEYHRGALNAGTGQVLAQVTVT